MDRLVAEPVLDLRPHLEGCADRLVYGVGHDDAFYAVAPVTAEAPRDAKGRWKSTLDSPTDYVVLRVRDGAVERTVVRNESLHITHIQPCPEGLLLLGSRCVWRRSGPEKNALVVNSRGETLRCFTAGDGISDVRVAADGTIWVSYMDEGVFGNCGWSIPGPEPIGASGLVAFDAHGNVTCTYDRKAAGTDFICDAYALNVTEDGAAWVYFYTDFPLVRIYQGRYRAWACNVKGARAVAIRGRNALLVGNREHAGVATLLELPEKPGSSSRVLSERMLTDADGNGFDRAEAHGQGHTLILVRDRVVYSVSDW
jgi:hypothetical protein